MSGDLRAAIERAQMANAEALRDRLLRPSTEPAFVETLPGCFVSELPPTEDVVLQLLHRVAVLEAQVAELRAGWAS
jgi:hypothetical protein